MLNVQKILVLPDEKFQRLPPFSLAFTVLKGPLQAAGGIQTSVVLPTDELQITPVQQDVSTTGMAVMGVTKDILIGFED